MIRIDKPLEGEYAPYAKQYIDVVADSGDPIGRIEENRRQMVALMRSLPPEMHDYRYAEGKWSLKELLLHVTDTERIFTYRALRIARNDKTPLPGFEEKDYAAESMASTRSMDDLLAEYEAVKDATLALLTSFTEEMFFRTGTASGHNVSVRGLIYMIAGHERHHHRIINERYLNQR